MLLSILLHTFGLFVLLETDDLYVLAVESEKGGVNVCRC